MSNMKVVLAFCGGTKGFLLYPAMRTRNYRGLVALEISKEAFLPWAAPLQGQSSLGLGLPRSSAEPRAHVLRPSPKPHENWDLQRKCPEPFMLTRCSYRKGKGNGIFICAGLFMAF